MRPGASAGAERAGSPRLRRSVVLPGLLLGICVAAVACAGGPSVRQVCLEVRASPSLNPYDGQPHVVVLHLFPLETSLGFEQASADDLLGGAMPPGVAGAPLQLTVGPGQELDVEERVSPTAQQLGLVADYYRAPGDAAGSRKAVVPADCGWLGTPSVVLSPRDLLVE